MACNVNLSQYAVNLHANADKIGKCWKNFNVFLVAAEPDGTAPEPTDGAYEAVPYNKIKTNTPYFMVARIENVASSVAIISDFAFMASNGMTVGDVPTDKLSATVPFPVPAGGTAEIISTQAIKFTEAAHNCIKAQILGLLREVSGFEPLPEKAPTSGPLFAQYNVNVKTLSTKQRQAEIPFTMDTNINEVQVTPENQDANTRRLRAFGVEAEAHPTFHVRIEEDPTPNTITPEALLGRRAVPVPGQSKNLKLTIEAPEDMLPGTSAAYSVSNADETEGFTLIINYKADTEVS